MQLNKDTAISTSYVLLVPYEPHHVPTYHGWMKDEEIQAATASEPLSLAEEYTMQATWRSDVDKLTFILCQPLPRLVSSSSPVSLDTSLATASIAAGITDAPSHLLGDINLFLSPPADPPSSGSENLKSIPPVGELELMIAPKTQRRRGYGRAALLAFMIYLERHVREILAEYSPIFCGTGIIPSPHPVASSDLTATSHPNPGSFPKPTLQIRAKIGKNNFQSLALFRAVGFVPTNGGVENYFGEVEMVLPFYVGEGTISEPWANEILSRHGSDTAPDMRYHEIGYCR